MLNLGDLFRRHSFTLKRAKDLNNSLAPNLQTWWSNEPQWFPGNTSPKLHNRAVPLVDGANYLRELEIALKEAKHYIFIAGWALTPHFPLNRNDLEQVEKSRLLKLIEEASKKIPVRILLWNGAMFLFQPDRRETARVKKMLEDSGGKDLKCRLDKTARPSHCHHQKTVIIDGKVAFLGGIDLTTFSGDRFDNQKHPLRAGINWHDVQLKLEGECVADVEQNFRQRWEGAGKNESLGIPPQAPFYDSAWNTPVQVLRTIPKKFYNFAPRGEFGIHHAYMALISHARHYIYLENQYLWSPHILEALTKAMETPRTGPFKILILLPASAEDGKWDNDKHVEKLKKLDNGRDIVSVYSLYTSGPNTGKNPFTYRDIYVHSKTVIVDDEWFMIGSANLNNRGFITDSEINALVHNKEIARDLRLNLWSEHLNLKKEELANREIASVIDREWQEKAEANQEIIKVKEKPLPCAIFPYTTGHMPTSWLLEEVEEISLEH